MSGWVRCRGVLIAALLIASSACAPTAGPTPSRPTPVTPAPATASPGATATGSPPIPEPSPTAGTTPTSTAGATVPTSPSGSPAEPTPSGPSPIDGLRLTLEPFIDGLASPVFLTHAGDGTGVLYVVERSGTIATVQPDGTLGEPFLDITDLVQAGGEQGLLGLAFHPGYPDDDRFFVMYTSVDEGDNTIAQYHAPEGIGDPDSETILLAIEDFAGNHNGGMVAFGPDGYLYAGTGDGGGGGDPEGNGQDPRALLGKILRLDVDAGDPYGIPPDNPGAQGGELAPEIWALGMRNPWRFSFDRETGDLWIGDVGQGGWEEIDVQPAGEGGLNFGWDTMEGPDCFAVESCDREGLTLPVVAYPREAGSTVIGGYVYRGIVEQAHGAYLFGDYGAQRIWAIDATAALAGGPVQMHELLTTDVVLSSFGEDEDGELYAVDLAGRVLRAELSIAD